MLRRASFVLVFAACGACMEMRETVERMVMVRTTGSDLQPAATGYIYKKQNDGAESVVEMGESEIMQHLSKLYDRPQDFVDTTSSETYVTGGGANKADSSGEERVVPVKEHQEDHNDDGVDVDYKKIFDDYTANYGDKSTYDDYLQRLKRFKGGLRRKHIGVSAEDDKEYRNADDGTYHNAKYESYSISGGQKKDHGDGDDHKKYYVHSYHRGPKGTEQYANHDKGNEEEDAQGFHRTYNHNDNKNDQEYFDKTNKAHTDGHQFYATDDRRRGFDGTGHGGHKHDSYDESKYHEKESNEHQDPSHCSGKEHKTYHGSHGDNGPSGENTAGGGYDYKVKH